MAIVTKKLIGQMVRGTDKSDGIDYEGRVTDVGLTNGMYPPRSRWAWIEDSLDSDGVRGVCCLYEDEITHVNGKPVAR